MYKVLFAPDGEHFFTMKQNKGPDRIWDYFNFNPDIREQLYLNPQAKFKLIHDDFIIGELPRKGDENEINRIIS